MSQGSHLTINKFFKNVLAIVGIIIVSESLWADPVKMSYEEYVQKMAPVSSWKGIPKTPHRETSALIQEQESKRKVAQSNGSSLDASFFESKMSDPYKKFREEFLKIKTAEELDQKLSELEMDYDKIPDTAMDLKFVAAQLIPFRTFRGLVWRLIPPMEESKIAHSFVLTQVKNIAIGIKIFFPTEQWQAGISYLTEPFVQNGLTPFSEAGVMIKQFPKRGDPDLKGADPEAALQAYVIYDIIPAFKKAAERLEKVDMSAGPFVWDNKFWYGTGGFKSAIDRYAWMGEVERQTALTHIYAGLADTMYKAAYSWNTMFLMNKELGQLYGYDSILSTVDGVPASKRVAVIKKYSKWGLLFKNGGYGQELINESFEYLKKSVYAGELAYNAMKNRSPSEENLIDTSFAIPFQRPIHMRFDNLKAMLQGEKTVQSFITEEPVRVNLPQWYKAPVADLKMLYATGFESGEEFIKNKTVSYVEVGTQKKQTKTLPPFRNYLRGRPQEWKNISEFKKILPDATSSNLEKQARILSQAWGGGFIAMPVSEYLF